MSNKKIVSDNFKDEESKESRVIVRNEDIVTDKIKQFEKLIVDSGINTQELLKSKEKLLEDKSKKSEELEFIVDSLNKITTINEKIIGKVNENNKLEQDITALNSDLTLINSKYDNKLDELNQTINSIDDFLKKNK
tara:strand:- start:2601 stop:3008 length:408 start_codon:yes stop_codon:yes gene_type:complete